VSNPSARRATRNQRPIVTITAFATRDLAEKMRVQWSICPAERGAAERLPATTAIDQQTPFSGTVTIVVVKGGE
jgi:hypothetical protein